MTYPGCGINRLLAILIASILFVGAGCQRATSLETPDTETEDQTGYGSVAAPAYTSISGTSKFILVPSGAHCSDAVVHGSYTEKSRLTLHDFVVLTVEVISPGTWAYTTSTIKGFKFGNSGNFTSTGQQQIILIASGTPNSSGVAEFLLSVGTAGCSVKVEVKAPGAVGLGAQGEFYCKATIGGADYFEVVTDPGNFEAGSGVNGVDEVSINAAIYHMADPMPLGVTAFGV